MGREADGWRRASIVLGIALALAAVIWGAILYQNGVTEARVAQWLELHNQTAESHPPLVAGYAELRDQLARIERAAARIPVLEEKLDLLLGILGQASPRRERGGP